MPSQHSGDSLTWRAFCPESCRFLLFGGSTGSWTARRIHCSESCATKICVSWWRDLCPRLAVHHNLPTGYVLTRFDGSKDLSWGCKSILRQLQGSGSVIKGQPAQDLPTLIQEAVDSDPDLTSAEGSAVRALSSAKAWERLSLSIQIP